MTSFIPDACFVTRTHLRFTSVCVCVRVSFKDGGKLLMPMTCLVEPVGSRTSVRVFTHFHLILLLLWEPKKRGAAGKETSQGAGNISAVR